jgi:hypothetical protein
MLLEEYSEQKGELLEAGGNHTNGSHRILGFLNITYFSA